MVYLQYTEELQSAYDQEDIRNDPFHLPAISANKQILWYCMFAFGDDSTFFSETDDLRHND